MYPCVIKKYDVSNSEDSHENSLILYGLFNNIHYFIGLFITKCVRFGIGIVIVTFNVILE